MDRLQGNGLYRCPQNGIPCDHVLTHSVSTDQSGLDLCAVPIKLNKHVRIQRLENWTAYEKEIRPCKHMEKVRKNM